MRDGKEREESAKDGTIHQRMGTAGKPSSTKLGSDPPMQRLWRSCGEGVLLQPLWIIESIAAMSKAIDPTKREEIIRMAREAGTPYVNRHFKGQTSYGFTEESLLRFASLVAAAKQEECAKVCEKLMWLEEPGNLAENCADAIRALK